MENQNPAGKDFANGVFFGELSDADIEFIWQDRNVYLLTMHAELVGSPDGDIPPGTSTLTFRITDDDVDAAGARRPIAGASGTGRDCLLRLAARSAGPRPGAGAHGACGTHRRRDGGW